MSSRKPFSYPMSRWLGIISVVLAAALAVTGLTGSPALGTPSVSAGAAAVANTATAQTSTEPLLLTEKTTASSQTWLKADGSFHTEVSPGPVNFRDSDGDWHRIDNTLVDSDRPGVAVENAANEVSVRLPEDPSTKPVRVVDGSAWVAFQMHGLHGAPTVAGTEATYTEASNAARVTYEATPDGVKESIVLDAAPSQPVSFVFDVSLSSGLRPSLENSGELSVLDVNDKVRFTMPAPFMADSSDDVEPATSRDVDYRLSQSDLGWQLTITPDQGWLTDAGRAYPVVVDPWVSIAPDHDATIAKPSPNVSNTSSSYLSVGTTDGTSSTARRALLLFDVPVPANATVQNANLHLYLDATQSTSGLADEYVTRRLTRQWGTVSGTPTWNTATTVDWTTPGGDYVSSSVPGLSIAGTSTGDKAIPMEAITQEWINGAANHGVIVIQKGENTANLLKFYSLNYSDAGKQPKLNIDYTEPTLPAASQAGDRKFYTYTTERLTDRMTAKVNVGNGNLLVTANDFKVPGVAGLDLSLARSYNSALAGSSGTDMSKLGPGWSDNLGGSVRLEFPNGDDKRVFFHGPSGYRVRFERSPGGGYLRYEPGLEGNLRYDSGSNTLRVEMYDKRVYVFKPFTDTAKGQLTELRDKQGNKITFAYNADGTLATATDTRNRTAVFSYGAGDGMLDTVEIRTPAGTPLLRYRYGHSATTPARLVSSQVEYVNTGVLTDTTDSATSGNLTKLTTYGYDSSGRLNQIKDARENDPSTNGTLGGTTTIEYDAAGKVFRLNRLTDDTTLPDSTSTYTYSSTLPSSCNGEGTHDTVVDGERTDVADTTTYCADDHDRVRRTIDAKGHVRKSTYTANSNIATYDGSGLSSGGSSFTFGYDSNDNATSVSTPSGGNASAQYADAANPNFPTSMRDFDTGGAASAPATWAYDYDDNGNLIEVQAPVTTGKNISYRYCWDGNGQLQRVDPIDAAGNQSTTLDTSLTAGCGTGAQGNDTIYTYDADNQLISIDPPGAHRTQTYTYDALSRVKTVTDGRGMVTTYTYDALDHVVAEIFDATSVPNRSGPTTATVSWDYDPAGNMVKLTDPTGPTTFLYDELNRTTSESQQAPASSKTYRYDPADNVREIEVSDEPEPTKYTYDSVNLVTSVDDQRIGANVVTFAYDRHDKRTQTTFPMPGGNNVIQRATYGDGGHLTCMYAYRQNTVPTGAGDDQCPAATAAGLLTFTSYDYTKPGTGLDTNTRYKATEKGGATTDYTYDPITRLTGATAKAGNGSTLRSFSYDYDRHSNLVKDVTAGSTPQLGTGTTTLAYNDAEELCWTYSGTSANGCASAPTGAKTYGYDGAGALGTASDGLNLAYNAIGQTASIDPAGAVGALPMTYQGVTQDRRISKDTLEMSYGFAGLSSQSTNSGVPHAEWFIRDPAGKLVSMINRVSSDPDRYYLTDAQDTVVATIDTTGKVQRYLYEPFGQQIRTWIDTNPTNNTTGAATPPDGSQTTTGSADDPTDVNPWRYASGYYDTQTGMLKYGTRYYMPNLARWTQTDPKAGKPQRPLTMNPYLYVADNPINRNDLSGRDWWDPTSWDTEGALALEDAAELFASAELLEGGSGIAALGVELLAVSAAATGVTAGLVFAGGVLAMASGIATIGFGIYLAYDAYN